MSTLFESAPATVEPIGPAGAGGGPTPKAKRSRKPKAPHYLAGTLPALNRSGGDALAYRLTREVRPWTLNVERQGGTGRYKRAKLVKDWREAFAQLADEAHMRPCGSIAVTVWPELRNGSGIPDTAACIGAAKAAIDGIKDAGIIPEDGPRYVRRVTFMAPIVSGRDALTLDVEVLS